MGVENWEVLCEEIIADKGLGSYEYGDLKKFCEQLAAVTDPQCWPHIRETLPRLVRNFFISVPRGPSRTMANEAGSSIETILRELERVCSFVADFRGVSGEHPPEIQEWKSELESVNTQFNKYLLRINGFKNSFSRLPKAAPVPDEDLAFTLMYLDAWIRKNPGELTFFGSPDALRKGRLKDRPGSGFILLYNLLFALKCQRSEAGLRSALKRGLLEINSVSRLKQKRDEILKDFQSRKFVSLNDESR